MGLHFSELFCRINLEETIFGKSNTEFIVPVKGDRPIFDGFNTVKNGKVYSIPVITEYDSILVYQLLTPKTENKPKPKYNQKQSEKNYNNNKNTPTPH